MAGSNGDNSNAASTGTKRNRFHSPPVELPSTNAQNFFEEAKITAAEENEVRRKFGKFCTKASVDKGEEEEAYLTLDDFCRMLQYYDCASAQHYEAYFHAIDRNRDDRLSFQEFFLGCCAADPSTVHILNSFTGYERAQYIFDFYDTNRSRALEFDEFARLAADCMSLPTTNPNDEQVKKQAIEKARDLGTLEEQGTLMHFTCVKFKKFYEFVQSERLRGTSRLFRFYKSIIKSRAGHQRRHATGANQSGTSGGTAGGNSGGTGGASGATNAASPAPSIAVTAPTPATSSSATAGTGGESQGGAGSANVTAPPVPSASRTTGHHGGAEDRHADDESQWDMEDCQWHAHLLALDSAYDAEGDESAGSADPPVDKRTTIPPAYASLTPAAPAPSVRVEPDQSPATESRALARQVLRNLAAGGPESTAAQCAAAGACSNQVSFTIATPAQLRSLCAAAIRLLEPEDMVLSGLQPPVKVFGPLNGQLLDLLSHFKWQNPPTDGGDILYTTYVFLGDYVDRGAFSLEVLTILLSLKVAYPHRVALLRGQHENRHINYHHGFRTECEQRLGTSEGIKVFEHANRVFEHMSIAAIIGGQIAALGPGIVPPSLTRLDQLRRYKKPLVVPHPSQARSTVPVDRLAEQMLLDMFTPPALMPKESGVVREATPDQVRLLCSQHKLAGILRGRQVSQQGYSFDCEGRILSVISCTDYCDLPGGNDAALLCITKEEGSTNLIIRPKVLTAKTGKLYKLLARRNSDTADQRSLMPRWPEQVRDATPGRIAVQRDSTEAAGLVVMPDRGLLPDQELALVKYPVFGPGCLPAGGATASLVHSSEKDSPRRPHRAIAEEGAPAFSSISIAQEDWVHMAGNGAASRGQSQQGLSDRRSFGNKRSASGSSGKVSPDSQPVTQVLRDDAIAEVTSPPASSPDRPKQPGPRSPGGTGKLSGGGGAMEGVASAGGARRGGSVTSTNGSRTSTRGMQQQSVTSSGGRGVGGKDKPSSAQASRGPSRTPGAAPSPKATSSGTSSRTGTRRNTGSEADHQAISAIAQHSVADRQALMQLLYQSSRSLSLASLPTAPSQLVQNPRAAADKPLVLHLCRLWVEAGLLDKDWEEALLMYSAELQKQQQRPKKQEPPPADGDEEGWVIETFSVWLLQRGSLLKECPQWFRAFDFDHDDMVGVADFIQGLVAAGGSRAAPSHTGVGLCVAMAIHRMLDLERGCSELERVLSEVGLANEFTSAQLTKAADIDFFRTSILPSIMPTSSLRLRIFASTSSD